MLVFCWISDISTTNWVTPLNCMENTLIFILGQEREKNTMQLFFGLTFIEQMPACMLSEEWYVSALEQCLLRSYFPSLFYFPPNH